MKPINLEGQIFGRLLVTKYHGKRGRERLWECICDCGELTIKQTNNLRSGRSKSCGCFKSEAISNKKNVDISGRKFGRLTVIDRCSDDNIKSISAWNCICECGKLIKVRSSKILHQNSCGCARKKFSSACDRGNNWRAENTDKVKISTRKHLYSPCKESSALFFRIPDVDNPNIVNGVVNVDCKKCGKQYAPSVIAIRTRIYAYEGKQPGESNFYCSEYCKSSCFIFNAKSNHIDPRLRKDEEETVRARSCQTKALKQLQCDHNNGQSYCEKCGDFVDVELHHTLPIAEFGEKAIDSSGHILLCAGCHTTIHKECFNNEKQRI
jgi:hypothetical protein